MSVSECAQKIVSDIGQNVFVIMKAKTSSQVRLNVNPVHLIAKMEAFTRIVIAVRMERTKRTQIIVRNVEIPRESTQIAHALMKQQNTISSAMSANFVRNKALESFQIVSVRITVYLRTAIANTAHLAQMEHTGIVCAKRMPLMTKGEMIVFHAQKAGKCSELIRIFIHKNFDNLFLNSFFFSTGIHPDCACIQESFQYDFEYNNCFECPTDIPNCECKNGVFSIKRRTCLFCPENSTGLLVPNIYFASLTIKNMK